MKNIFANLKPAALVSFIIVLPFVILEFAFNTVNRQNALDLIVLFGLLWLLPTAFIAILLPVARNIPAGKSITANPFNLLFRVAFLALIAIMWSGILIDQIPCFIGAPNCD